MKNQTPQIENKSRALADMGFWKFSLLMLCRRPANEMFHRVILRAHERSIITSTQLHEIAGIWNRMVNGN